MVTFYIPGTRFILFSYVTHVRNVKNTKPLALNEALIRHHHFSTTLSLRIARTYLSRMNTSLARTSVSRLCHPNIHPLREKRSSPTLMKSNNEVILPRYNAREKFPTVSLTKLTWKNYSRFWNSTSFSSVHSPCHFWAMTRESKCLFFFLNLFWKPN